jgi:hypothetical protein
VLHYYHSDCGGSIGILTRRCSRCGKKWPWRLLFQYPLPPEVFSASSKGPRLKRTARKTYYAKWANRYPQVGAFASRLPNWPRWARVLVLLVILAVFAFCSYKLWGLAKWIWH